MDEKTTTELVPVRDTTVDLPPILVAGTRRRSRPRSDSSIFRSPKYSTAGSPGAPAGTRSGPIART